jgi:hypothetical protein
MAMTLHQYTLRFAMEDHEHYWEAYSKDWVPWYIIQIKPKCSLAAIALGLWLEGTRREKEESEQWVNICLRYGLYEMLTYL